MTATGKRRSDFIVRPFVRILCSRLALRHVIVKPNYSAARRFREPPGYNRMYDTGRSRADQLGADLYGSGAMTDPGHSEGTRMVGEDVSGP